MVKKIVPVVLAILILFALAGCQSGGAGPTPTTLPPAKKEAQAAPSPSPAATPTARPLPTATISPPFTPSEVDELLARAAVDGFLSALVRGDGQRAMELWFTAKARQSYGPDWLAQFGQPGGYEIGTGGWQGGALYRASALLHGSAGGQKASEAWRLTVEVVPERGLWLIDEVVPEPVVAATEATSPSTTKPAPTPQPTVERLPGKMAFMTSVGSQIYLVNADGSGLRPIGGVAGMDPALSPDGTQVAYARWVDPRGIWVANVDGSDQRHYHLSNTARGPAWSPDGKRIVFWQYKWGPTAPERQCWSFAQGGSPNIPADAWDVETTENEICWTNPPDPHYQLAVVSLPGGEYEDWTSDWYSYGPTWSPDGKAVAYEAEKGLALNVIAGERSWLSDKSQDAMPAWSPNGRYIVFQYWSHDHWEILRINSDGSGRVALTKTTPLGERAENSVSPAWSPDGRYIAFVTDRRGRWEFWAMEVDGGNQRPLFDDGLPGGMALEYKNVRERMISWSK
jgi:predicted small lipoprotein YifL